MSQSRFSGPVVFSGRRWFKDMPVALDPDFVRVWDDFIGIAIDLTNDWTEVKDSSAAVAITADTINGYLTMTSNATTDDDGSSIQKNEIFLPVAGKDIWFETRLQAVDSDAEIDEQEICAGLTINFATNPEAMLAADDRIVFQVNDADPSIVCITELSGTPTTTDSGVDIVDSEDVTLSFKVEGVSRVKFYINRVLVATHTTNIVDDQLMTPALMQLSGDSGGTKKILVDYILAVATRTVAS